MKNRFIFNKRIRLLTPNEFSFVFQKPKKNKIHGILLFSRFNQLNFPRMGLAISKKYIKHAHERNRIKRHAREIFRLNQFKLLSKDFIITVSSEEIIFKNNQTLIQTFKRLWSHHSN